MLETVLGICLMAFTAALCLLLYRVSEQVKYWGIRRVQPKSVVQVDPRKPEPVVVTHICDCGTPITGAECPNCGKKRPAGKRPLESRRWAGFGRVKQEIEGGNDAA